MAVIREKRQFQIGPVGVARADTGGRYTAQQMINSGNELSSMLFQKLAQKAEKAGLEAGQAVERQKVVAIDPNTGKPEAYEAPSSFGGIASEAYQRVVMTRFQSSIEDEMQNKARELAAQYESNPNGANLYGEAMASYIASMANNAEGMFQTYINDVGTHYLQSTQTSMAISQVRRERAAAARAVARSASEALDTLEFTVATDGPDALAAGGAGSNVAAGGNSVVADGVASGLVDSDAGTAYSREANIRVTQGLIRHASTQLLNRGADGAATLTQLQAAIGTQNPALIPEEFSALRERYASLGSDYSAMADIERMADGLLGDQSQYLDAIVRQEQAQLEAQRNLDAWYLTQGAESNYLQNVAQAGSPFSSSVIAQNAATQYASIFNQAAGYAAQGDTVNANRIVETANRTLEGSFEALALRSVNNLTVAETAQLEDAYMNRQPSMAPSGSQAALSALIQLENSTGQVYEGFGSYVSSYRDAPAKYVAQMAEAEAMQVVSTQISPMIASISTGAVGVDAVISEINAVEGLGDETRASLIKDASVQGAKGQINTVMSNPLTAVQVNDATAYYDGVAGSGDTLTPQMRQALDQAKLFATDADSDTAVRSFLGSAGRLALDRVAERQKAAERQAELSTVLMTGGDPQSIDDRRLFGEALSVAYAPALGGRTLEQVFADPASLNDPALQPMFNHIESVQNLPQELVSRMKALASGNTTNALATMQYFANFNTRNTSTGPVISSAISQSLTNEEYANLSYVMASMNGQTGNLVSTNEDVARLIENRRMFNEDPNGQRIVQGVLGQSVNDFVASIDGYEDAPVTFSDSANAMVLQAIASGERSPSVIRDLVQNQMNAKYPVADGIVMGPVGSTRALMTLESSVGPQNANDFKEIISDRYSRATGRQAAIGWNPNDMFMNQPDYDQLFLAPLNPANSTDMRFAVYRRTEAGLEPELVMENVTVPSAGGIESVRSPMIISVNDNEFRARVAAKNNQYVTDALTKRSFVEQLGDFSGVE